MTGSQDERMREREKGEGHRAVKNEDGGEGRGGERGNRAQMKREKRE